MYVQDSRRVQAEAEQHIRETEEVVQVLRVSVKFVAATLLLFCTQRAVW